MEFAISNHEFLWAAFLFVSGLYVWDSIRMIRHIDWLKSDHRQTVDVLEGEIDKLMFEIELLTDPVPVPVGRDDEDDEGDW